MSRAVLLLAVLLAGCNEHSAFVAPKPACVIPLTVTPSKPVDTVTVLCRVAS